MQPPQPRSIRRAAGSPECRRAAHAACWQARLGIGSPIARSAGYPFRCSVFVSHPCLAAVEAARLAAILEIPTYSATRVTVTLDPPASLRAVTAVTVALTAGVTPVTAVSYI